MNLPFLEYIADSHQTPNPGGGLRFVKINCNDFLEPWPTAAHIANGEIIKLPKLKLNVNMVQILPVPNSIQYRYPKDGRHGHQHFSHEIAYEVANEGLEITTELEKDLNSRSVYMVCKPDGRIIVLGTSENGLYNTHESDSGLEGGENKTVIKAKCEVQMARPKFLKDTLSAQLMTGNDGYSWSFSLPTMNDFSTFNTAFTDYDFADLAGNAVGRGFKVGDAVKVRRIDLLERQAGRVVILPDSQGYATGTISAVSNPVASGFTRARVSTITFFNINIPANMIIPGFWRLKGPYILEKV